jgi:hypothetical protein
MKCRNARKLVYEFIDGLKDDTKRLELEKHLSGCPACDKLASQLTRSLDLLHRAPKEKTSEDFAWNLRMRINQERSAIHERSQANGSVFRSWNLRYATTAVAAFAVVLTVGLVSMKSGFNPPVRGPQAESPIVADATENSSIQEPVEGPPNIYDPRNQLFAVGEGSGGQYGADGGMIDAPSMMMPAELDSLVGVEMQGLTPEQRLRYLEELVNRHLQARYRSEIIKSHSR